MPTVVEPDLSKRITAALTKASIPAYEMTVPPEQVDVEAFNHVGDPLAEALVPELREHGQCRDPIAGARQLAAAGVRTAVAFLSDVEHVPAWADFEAMRAGASLGRRVPLALALGIHGALPLAYVDPTVAAVMQHTGRMTHGGSDFRQRFWETAAGFVGALDVDGMRPGGARWEQWVRIRLLHTSIRLAVLRSGVWDVERSMPISQSATAAGAHIFGRYRVNTIRALGGQVSDEEASSFALMWRWISRLQGANAELLGATPEQELRIQQRIHAHLYAPDETSRNTTAAMLDAIAGRSGFPVRLPRRVHAAFSRRLLQEHVVETLPGRDVPGDLGVPVDPVAAVVASAAVAGLHAADTVARLGPFGRLLDRHGQRLLDRQVAVGLGHRTPDFQPEDP